MTEPPAEDLPPDNPSPEPEPPAPRAEAPPAGATAGSSLDASRILVRALAEAIAAIITLLNAGARHWPADQPVSGSVDTGLVLRQLRMAAAWAGPCRAGALRSGNGRTTAAVELDGELARLSLAVEVDADSGQLRRVDVAPLS